jgi:hypothetical protein
MTAVREMKRVRGADFVPLRALVIGLVGRLSRCWVYCFQSGAGLRDRDG